MRFTTFSSTKDNVPHPYEGWDEFHKLFQVKVTSDKHSVKLYCPAEFADNRRLDRNVLHVSFGTIDVDDYGEDAVMDALNTLTEDLGLQVIFHTTHRYAESLPNKFKCRIIIPFSRPVEVDEWDRVWHGMNELVGNIADSQCRNPNRIYYFPSCPPGSEDLAIAEHMNPDGDVLDIDAFLEDVPDIPRKDSFIAEIDPEKLARIAADVRYKLAQMFLEQKFPPISEGSRNSTAYRVAMTCGDFGLDAAAGWPLVLDWNGRCTPPLDEDELQRTHESAYKEGGARSLPFGWRLFDQAQGDVVELKHVKDWVKKIAKRDGQEGRIGRRLEKIIKGDPIGTEAEQVFESVAAALARKYPQADPTQLALLLEESIKKTYSAGNRDITVEWVAHRINQAQEEIQAGRADEQLDRKLLERLTIKDAFRSVKQDRTTPYTRPEIKAFAKEGGLESIAEFRRRWILRSGKTFYFFVGGQYIRRTQDEALNSAHELLLPAKLPMYRDGANGPVPLKLHELIERYGCVVDKIYVDLTAQKTHYDWENKTVIEAPCPFRPLAPKYSKYVAEWLRALTTSDVLYERLLDWLACVPKVQRPSCALFLYGPPNTGKSLLPSKLARLWREYGGPTELESLATNFNEEMQECPIVFGDEYVPTDHRGDPRTDLLRKIVQEHDRTFKRKHIGDAKLLGAIRLVLAANRSDIFLSTHKTLTNNDITAINERFLCIRVDEGAANYLADLKHNKMDDPDVAAIFLGDAIPQHIWWLHENRPVVDNDRLIVSGMANSPLSLRLMVGTGLRSGICHWFTNYITASEEKRNMGNANISPIIDTMADGSARLLVTADMLYSLWSAFNPHEEKPRIDSLEKALGGVCDKRTTKRIDGKHYSMRVVNLLRVKYWAASSGRSPMEVFDAALETMKLPAPYLNPDVLLEDE